MPTPRPLHVTALSAARMVLLLGLIVAVGCELRAGEWSVFSLVMAVWVALPFLLLLGASSGERAPASGAAYLVGAGLLGWSSLVAYRPAALASSSTAVLVFVFLPLWQLVGAGVVVLIADRLARRSAAGRAPRAR